MFSVKPKNPADIEAENESRPPRPVDMVFNSADHDQGSSSDAPRFQLAQPLSNVVGACVLWTMIPYSWYTIDRTCNTFEVTVSSVSKKEDDSWDDPAVGTQTLALFPGTYDPSSLATEVKRAFASVTLESNLAFEVTFDTATARLIMYNVNLDIVNNKEDNYFTVKFDNPRLARMFGFVPGIEYKSSIQQIFVAGQLRKMGEQIQFHAIRAPYQTNLMESPAVRIHSRSLAPLISVGATRPTTGNSEIIAEVPLTGNFTSYMHNQTNGAMIALSRTVIKEVDLFLRLGDRRLYAANSHSPTNNDFILTDYLPMNNIDFEVCIRFFVDDGVKLT